MNWTGNCPEDDLDGWEAFEEEEGRRRYDAERAERVAEQAPAPAVLWRHTQDRVPERSAA